MRATPIATRIRNHSFLQSQRMRFQGAPRDSWSFIRTVRTDWPGVATCCNAQVRSDPRHTDLVANIAAADPEQTPLHGGRSEWRQGLVERIYFGLTELQSS
jgi:hypothetical protein